MTPAPARILIIEDERAVRESMGAYLEDSGFEISEAENGRTGIDMCRTQRPDVVLCDLRMPEMDGLEVLALVIGELPETPVIIVSGMGGMGDAINALKLGAWDYVTKPIGDMAVLEHAINQALERARLLRENREYREHLEAANERLHRSLQQLEEDEEAGRRMQFQLLPEMHKAYGGYHFSRHLLTSTLLSGDFVDYFPIDDRRLGFYMADVSGHGVSSALITVLLKSYMNRFLELSRQDGDPTVLEPAETLRRLNTQILEGRLGKYLTMFYGVIDRGSNRLRFSNGGQFPFPILYDGSETRRVGGKSLPVGLFRQAEYRTAELDLPDKFIMTIVSDGIFDFLRQDNLEEKQAFLMKAAGRADLSMASLMSELGLDDCEALPDDITLMMIRRGM